MEQRGEHGNRILVPLDGSDLAAQALPYARALTASGGELLLLHVLPDSSATRGLRGELSAAARKLTERHQQRTVAVQRDLDAIAQQLRGGNNARHVETVVVAGDPAEQIVGVAEQRQANLIVMSSRGHGAVGRLLYGSVADRVARVATLPVMIVSHREAPATADASPIRRLVVPLDGSDLAAQALPVATDWAHRLGVPIFLVSVVDTGLAAAAFADGGFGADYTSAVLDEDVRQELQTTAQTVLEREGQKLIGNGIAATWEVREGPPAPTIIDAVVPGDVIILTSRGQSGMTRWLLGSVAEKLIHDGPVPVVLLRAAPVEAGDTSG